MIRFILKRRIKDEWNGLYTEQIETFDLDLPLLEERMMRGGYGERSFDHTELLGIEVVK